MNGTKHSCPQEVFGEAQIGKDLLITSRDF